MLTRNPQPWHFIAYLGFTALSPFTILIMPQVLIDKWPGLVFLSVGGTMATGMASYIYCGAIFTSNIVKANKRDIRMFQQPTEEEKKREANIVARASEELVKVRVNVGDDERDIVIQKGNNVQKTPASFVAHQNTAEVVSLSKVDSAISKVCRYNWMLIENGSPEGDFRYDTWVRTKKMSNKTLLIVIGILERYGGVMRKGNSTSGKDSRWIVRDPEVIKRGKQDRFEHPLDCLCDGCKIRNT